MMTRAEYMTMAEYAIAKYEHLLNTLPRGTDIVFVVSRDVYLAMISYERTNVQVNFATGVNAAYMGAPICCINEDSEDFFMPVVYSHHFQHYNGVQVGDFVLFNDEDDDLLYRLVRLTPETIYTDTGLTVSFIDDTTPTRNHTDAVAAVAANAAVEATLATDMATAAADTIAYHADAITYAGIPVEDYAGIADVAAVDDVTQWLRDNGTELVGTIDRAITREELDRIADAWNNTPAEPLTFAADRINTDPFVARINEEVLEQLAGWRPQYMAQWVTEPAQTERPVRAKRKTVVKEKELNPGDTKLIDEYLNSFLRSGV